MGQFAQAVDYGNDFIKKHPQHRQQVLDYFQLMKDEVEEGGSVQHEIDLFIGACDDLLNEDEE
jgi:outer membrane protein assembly factor BamD (BamD/ComL family)